MFDGDVEKSCSMPSIIQKELSAVFKNRLSILKNATTEDELKEKVKILEEYNKSLEETNSDMILSHTDLRNQVIRSHEVLERKLKKDVNSFGDCKIVKLQNDLKNLMELIKQTADQKDFDWTKIKFHTIQEEDFLGLKRALTRENVLSDQVMELKAKLNEKVKENEHFATMLREIKEADGAYKDKMESFSRRIEEQEAKIKLKEKNYEQLLVKLSTLETENKELMKNQNLISDLNVNSNKNLIDLGQDSETTLIPLPEEDEEEELTSIDLSLPTESNLEKCLKQAQILHQSLVDVIEKIKTSPEMIETVIQTFAAIGNTLRKMSGLIDEVKPHLNYSEETVSRSIVAEVEVKPDEMEALKLLKRVCKTISEMSYPISSDSEGFFEEAEEDLDQIDSESLLTTLEKFSCDTKSLKEKIRSVQSELTDTKRQNKELRDTIDSLQVEYEMSQKEAKMQNENFSAEIDNFKKRLNRASETIRSAVCLIDPCHQSVGEDEGRIFLSELRYFIENSKAEKDAINDKIQRLSLELANMKVNKSSLTERADKLASMCQIITNELIILLDKAVSMDSADSDFESLSGLMADLKREIQVKDRLLDERRRAVDELEQQLAEAQARLDNTDGEKTKVGVRMAELETEVKRIGAEKIQLATQLNETAEERSRLDNALQEARTAFVKETEKTLKLEHECQNQLQTISHLRAVLEETKRNGNASVSNNSLFSSFWRSVHDV